MSSDPYDSYSDDQLLQAVEIKKAFGKAPHEMSQEELDKAVSSISGFQNQQDPTKSFVPEMLAGAKTGLGFFGNYPLAKAEERSELGRRPNLIPTDSDPYNYSPEKMKVTQRGMQQGYLFGHRPQVEAGAKTGFGYLGDYPAERDKLIAEEKAIRASDPKRYGGGELMGNVMNPVGKVIGAGVNAASKAIPYFSKLPSLLQEGAKAIPIAGAYGLAQKPENLPGDKDVMQLPQRTEQAREMMKTAPLQTMALQTAGRGLDIAGQKIQDHAARKVVTKTLDASPKAIEKLDKKGNLENVGREAIESGVVTAAGNPKKLAQRAEAATENQEDVVQGIINQAEQHVKALPGSAAQSMLVYKSDVADRAHELVDKAGGRLSPETMKGAHDMVDELITRNPNFGIVKDAGFTTVGGANELKRSINPLIRQSEYDQTVPKSKVRGAKETRRALREIEEQKFGEMTEEGVPAFKDKGAPKLNLVDPKTGKPKTTGGARSGMGAPPLKQPADALGEANKKLGNRLEVEKLAGKRSAKGEKDQGFLRTLTSGAIGGAMFSLPSAMHGHLDPAATAIGTGVGLAVGGGRGLMNKMPGLVPVSQYKTGKLLSLPDASLGKMIRENPHLIPALINEMKLQKPEILKKDEEK